jgi:predicted nucleotidyltransferase
MNFIKILKRLHKYKLKYLIAGGVAVNLHGYTRATADLDIIISLADSEVSKFVKAAKSLKMVPRIPVKLEELADPKKRKEWIEEKNMLVFSVHNPKDPLEHIDVMIHHGKNFDKFYKNHVKMRLENTFLPVISLADLIKLKKEAGRGRDKVDIEFLNKIKRIK